MPLHHLAQVNIATMRAPLSDPLMADFVAQLEAVNAIADASPGFVWRLQTDAGNATDLRAYDNERILFNLSVWESLEALFEYVYRSQHGVAMRDRRKWFEPVPQPTVALWWIPAGHIPTVLEAKERLEYLRQQGPTPYAFSFRQPFSVAKLLDSKV
ncbi:DUF3291 domain-containing protein [Leptolyngbya sp. NK1-12]|uniref:DUF3291 domain-containing protein n=1 Tax=Leptolyngbya sp. NK1-12 TaxID=2547451 RepID=A0AA96WDF2_9CYAN|nr:DUF3291 domain-containing protein [Leptolyngbya sp. NK1-12]WNZ22915.1 DUF3291 domain-containing protein [Leptolyngbya sp. NK1-12]